MNEVFKKWLCEKTGINRFDIKYQLRWNDFELELLIKAMWAINREGEWHITLSYNRMTCFSADFDIDSKTYYFRDHNNSEQDALTKALEYIFKQEQE